MIELNTHHMLRIANTLGIDLLQAVLSDKLKDKQLPIEFYRNRYQKENDDILNELVLCGIAVKDKWQDLMFYSITDDGIKQFRKQYEILVNYKPKKEQDLSYLKNKINFYCDFYNYRFCVDNSEHIIEYYKKYFIYGDYISHTTEDCIMQFKKELRSYYKRGLI